MRETPLPSRSHRVYRACRGEQRWKSSSSVAGPFLRKPVDHSAPACRWCLGSPRSRECGAPLSPLSMSERTNARVHIRRLDTSRAATVRSAASGGGTFDRDGGRLAAADAEAGNSPLGSAALQRVQQGDDDPGAGGADRMPERAGAAVDVDAFAVEPEIANGRHRHHRECFVDLEQIDVAYGPVRPFQGFANGGDRRGGEPPRLLRVARLGDDG